MTRQDSDELIVLCKNYSDLDQIFRDTADVISPRRAKLDRSVPTNYRIYLPGVCVRFMTVSYYDLIGRYGRSGVKTISSKTLRKKLNEYGEGATFDNVIYKTL